MEHRHEWVRAAQPALGCTVVVRDAGPSTNPLCNVRALVECADTGLAHERCAEARCRAHLPDDALRSRPGAETTTKETR